jgi:hypothetical protein
MVDPAESGTLPEVSMTGDPAECRRVWADGRAWARSLIFLVVLSSGCEFTSVGRMFRPDPPPGISFATVMVDATGDVGRSCDIAVDASGRVHIVYFEETHQDLRYATGTSVPRDLAGELSEQALHRGC